MLRNRFRRCGYFFLALGLLLLLGGCSLNSMIAFTPAGIVAQRERDLMILTFVLMLFVFIPVVALTLFFAWRYRASNTEARYAPKWSHSWILEVFLWGGPIVIILVLSVVTWYSTHELDPYKPLKSKNETIQVDAIALNWKWLFVYPKYNVASVNEMAMPVNTPLSIHLTSDTVMTSFMIPSLGSQIFAMSGMQTQLHLMASKKGIFFGKNYQYTGDGFAKETFHAKSLSQQGFKQWVAKAKSSGQSLDESAYAKLAKPSETNKILFYSPVKPRLFHYVMKQYHSGKPHNVFNQTAER